MSGPRKTTTAAPVNRHHQIKDVYRSKDLVISSDEKLTKKQIRRIAAEVRDAYHVDAFEQDAHRTPKKPIVVGVFSDKTFSQIAPPESFGVTLDRNTIALSDTIARNGGNGGDRAVLAHELSHLQDHRAAGKRYDRVPTYLEEGKAVVLGDVYDRRRGLKNPAIAESAKALGQYTADDARQVFENFAGNEAPELRRGNGARDERIGALFVEFLRTRLSANGHQGRSNAYAALDAAVRRVGKGQGFDQAFKKEFGVSLDDAKNQFLAFMKQTEGDPQARLAGTIWQQPTRGTSRPG